MPWREAGPSKHLDEKVDLNQEAVNEELSLCSAPSESRSRVFRPLTYPPKSDCRYPESICYSLAGPKKSVINGGSGYFG